MSDTNHLDPDETIRPLPEDNDPPFSDPSQVDNDMPAEKVDETRPEFDNENEIDSHEAYDRGRSRAAGIEEPNGDSAVTGYDPDNDQRKN